MTDESVAELETLAALYALGHLHGDERATFEASLRDPQSPVAAYLRKFQQVAAALSWGSPKEPPPGLRARLLERVREEGPPPPPASGRITLAPGLLLVLAERLTWQESGVPGVCYKPLFVDPQRRYASSLVTMVPGTTFPRHRHAQVEELFMLSGDIQVDGYQLQPGDYCRAEAGTLHEALHTETGCTFIALASLDDEYLPAESGAKAASAPPAAPPVPSGEAM